MNEPVLFFAGYLLLKYLKLIINVFRDWASIIRQQYEGIILTDFRENRLYLIKYMDIFIPIGGRLLFLLFDLIHNVLI